VRLEAFDRIVKLLAPPSLAAGTLLPTGIKVIDVMCPLVAGGTLAIAGEWKAGTAVVMEELVRRLSGGTDRISMFTFMPSGRGITHAEMREKEATATAPWARCRRSSSAARTARGRPRACRRSRGRTW